MKSRLLRSNGERVFAVVFEKDDDVLKELREFAREHQLAGSQFTGIGAFRQVTLGFFKPDTRDYAKTEIPEQVEVLSLAGNITLQDSEPKIHAHAVVSRADGAAMGGHLLGGVVWPTLELVVTELPSELQRETDQETGLALIRL